MSRETKRRCHQLWRLRTSNDHGIAVVQAGRSPGMERGGFSLCQYRRLDNPPLSPLVGGTAD